MSRFDWGLFALIAVSLLVGEGIFRIQESRSLVLLITFTFVLVFSGACAMAWWSRILKLTVNEKKPLDASLINVAIRSECLLLSFLTPQREIFDKDFVLDSSDLGQKLTKRIPNIVGMAIIAIWFLYLLLSDPKFRSGRGLFGDALNIPIVFTLIHGISIYIAIWALSFAFLVQFAKFKGRQK